MLASSLCKRRLENNSTVPNTNSISHSFSHFGWWFVEAILKKVFEAISSILVKTEAVRYFQPQSAQRLLYLHEILILYHRVRRGALCFLCVFSVFSAVIVFFHPRGYRVYSLCSLCLLCVLCGFRISLTTEGAALVLRVLCVFSVFSAVAVFL